MPLLLAFDDLLQGLRNIGGPVLPWVLLIGIPIVAVALFWGVQVLRSRKATLDRAQTQYHQALKRKALDPAQTALVETLAAQLADPLRRHELLDSPRLFQLAAERALRSGRAQEDAIAALRVTLGFRTRDGDQAVYSTAQLPDELPLIVEQGKVRRFRAHTEKVEPDAITIVAEDGEMPPAAGSALQVYFKREAGVFTFASRVLSLEGSRARIAHTETIGRYQKRAYYRRKIGMPVMVRLAGSDEKHHSYKFVDLGGGGASVTNPDLRFRPGDDIEIMFRPGPDAPIELVGEVIRLSEAGKVMHVSFGPVREAMRDRVIGFILNVRKKS